MTCIVGLVHDGRVYLGGDSAAIAGHASSATRQPKVFARDAIVIGYTSSFRMGQLLEHSLAVPPLPPIPALSLSRWMALDFVNAVRDCLKSGGFATTKDGAEAGGSFLVGASGRLFRLNSDYGVTENVRGIDAVGCGDDFAMGALVALRRVKLPPEEKIRRALAAADECSSGVRGPFYVVTT